MLLQGVSASLEDYEYASVDQIRGRLSLPNCPDRAAFERANYTSMLIAEEVTR
jgi:hypothetical protein